MSSTSTPNQATPKEIWQNAKADLELQLARATYDTWLRGAHFLAYEDGEFIIGVSSSFAADWLNSRLHPLIKRTLCWLKGHAVEVRFVVQPKRVRDDLSRPAPLLETVSPAAAKTDQAYNPFFIYAGVGLGKTHLLHSIGHEARRRGYGVLYVPSEGFTNDFVESLKNGSPEAFREKYRTIDVLLLDDVQFIAGKNSTQEELFHTFNALHMAGKQIVLSADSMPDHIAALENRLSSRFKSGLCVDLEPPGLETRIAILQMKMEDKGWSAVPDDVIESIAQRLPGSVRRLEGAPADGGSGRGGAA
jgi:chromosomal replication initiator protein